MSNYIITRNERVMPISYDEHVYAEEFVEFLKSKDITPATYKIEKIATPDLKEKNVRLSNENSQLKYTISRLQSEIRSLKES